MSESPDNREYRDNLAKELKDLPKEERHTALETEKNAPQYWNARSDKIETLHPHEAPPSAYGSKLAEKYHSAQQKTFKKEGTPEDTESIPDISTQGIEEYLRESLEGKQDAHVVDIGCGARADFLEKWKNAGDVSIVIGVEASERMRELLKENLTDEHIMVQAGDWLDTRLPRETADAVVSRFSFHHVEDIDKAYEELARILKPGGRAIIGVPHPDYVKAEFKAQGIAPTERAEIMVNVLDQLITYYYHSLEDYFHCRAFEDNFRLIDSRVGDFKKGTWGTSEGEVPNALIFEIEKIP